MSLRARLMVIGVAGVALSLALGSIALYAVLTVALDRALESTARASATEVAALIDRGALPNPLPVSGVQVVQVVDAQSRVIAASATADRLVPLLHPAELAGGRSGAQLTLPGSRAGVDGRLRVLVSTAGPASAPVFIVVAVPVGDVEHSERLLRTTLLLTYPLLLAVLALIAWRVIDRALRPVEALRAGAERISGTGYDERLPVPESADEIRALALTLNGMLDRLAMARSRQRSFVADAAHELRSPLASMQTQLEVAQRLGEGGSLAPDLLADVARLTRLVEDLLLLARADADIRPPAQSREVDLATVAARVAARHTGARVPVTDRSEGSPVVLGDEWELERVITNLVDNAVRHARTGVSVAATAGGDGREVMVAIRDDGPGIPAAEHERVFDRFTRLDDARDRDAGGTGLGLTITRELVRRAGGTISLADAGPGLLVQIRLPALAPGTPRTHPPGAADPPDAADPPEGADPPEEAEPPRPARTAPPGAVGSGVEALGVGGAVVPLKFLDAVVRALQRLGDPRS